MKLTSQQEETVRREWGKDADNILKRFANKRGKCNIFKEDGSLLMSKAETEEKLTTSVRTKREEKERRINKSYFNKDYSISEIKREISKVSNLELEELKDYIDEVIKNNKEKEKEERRKAVEKEIEDAREALEKATQRYEEAVAEQKELDEEVVLDMNPMNLEEDAMKVINASK